MRRDALRNRQQLIRAAASVFRQDGLGASVNAVAAAADVNIATLYRNFPTKDHLVAAVLESILEPLVTARDDALAACERVDGDVEPAGDPDEPEEPTSDDVLRRFVASAAHAQAQHGGIYDALRGGQTDPGVRKQLGEVAMEIVLPIVQRAHRDGVLHPDLDAHDVLIALRMLGSTAGLDEFGRPVERYVEIVLRGLRPALAAAA